MLAIGVAAFVQSRTDTGSPKETFENEPVEDLSKQAKSVPVPQEARKAAVDVPPDRRGAQEPRQGVDGRGPGHQGRADLQELAEAARSRSSRTPASRWTRRRSRSTGRIPNSIGLSVALLPRKGSTEKPQVFNMELKKAGKRWVVDSWVPYAPPAVPSDLSQ